MLKKWMPIGLGLVVVVASSVVHGVLSNRWGLPPDLGAAAARLDQIPHVIGDWYSREVEVPPKQLAGAEATGHFSRVYRNDKTQEEIQVLVLCGSHGPIAVHPPTVCFTSAGFVLAAEEVKHQVKLEEGRGEFWKATFRKRSPDGLPLAMRTYWAWSVEGECQAADNPRMEYAMEPHLFKIYVTRMLNAREEEEEKSDQDSPSDEFLEVFLPRFQTALSGQPQADG